MNKMPTEQMLLVITSAHSTILLRFTELILNRFIPHWLRLHSFFIIEDRGVRLLFFVEVGLPALPTEQAALTFLNYY